MSGNGDAARERFAGLLGEVGAAGAFSARRTARPDDLRLEVRGVGPIELPVPVRQAKQLCLVGRPARFGRGEETLLDRRVRDTWEIPKSRITIDRRQWDRTLRPMLDRLRADLGLPAGCGLAAEFHAMLVYGPGQFFAPHQDSEKSDAMIGTLVVALPSNAEGGELRVQHAGTTARYRSSSTSLSFVAFYADCRHDVSPVTSGHRTVLTYNLLLVGDTAAAAADRVDPELTKRLAGCLEEHFATRVPAWYGGADRDPPNRLVYLLDHQYTERGLSWGRLKGADAERAVAVRAAAEAAGCEAVLALAEVHETWEAHAEEEPSWRRRWYSDEDDDLIGEPELHDLIESTVHLDRWLSDPDGPATPTSLTVGEHEVCATTPSVNLVPYASEYEGYMGNYGNTADRWYRRAALVVWPRQFGFAVRAEASPEWALDALATQIRAGDVAGARERAATVEPFWSTSAGAAQRSVVLGKALRVARGLDDADLATMLLAPFRVETLTKGHAAPAAGVVARYGQAWAEDLVRVWHRSSGGPTDRRPWLASLSSVCGSLCDHSADGKALATMVVAGSWARLRDEIDASAGGSTPSRRAKTLAGLGPSVTAVLTAAAACGASDQRDAIVGFLGQEDLLACVMATLRAGASLPASDRRASGLDALAEQCAALLAARLARPTRAADDWSVAPPRGCGCEVCATLADFLRDPTRRGYDWPLAMDGRKHVHQVIDRGELPVRHETRRTGRPFTLVLTKTEALFDRERQRRERDEADLAWLKRQGW